MRCYSSLPITLLLVAHAACSGCGVPSGLARIVGGRAVPGGRYPWYVALVPTAPGSSATSIPVSCGASLITSRHLLTAAHCFPKSLGSRPELLYRAVFLLRDRCLQLDHPSGAGLLRVAVYPSFDPRTLQGDVAVATLDRAVPYTPVCLPPTGQVPKGEAVIVGFGSTLTRSTQATDDGSPYPCTLQEATVPILSRRQCQRTALRPEYSRVPGTFCAGFLRGGTDSCDGDSGGPLQTVKSGIYTIEGKGIVSFGEGCARKNLPGVYTQVSAYRRFIDAVIQSSDVDSEVRTNPNDPDRDRFLHFLNERRAELFKTRVPVVVGVTSALVALLVAAISYYHHCRRSSRASSAPTQGSS